MAKVLASREQRLRTLENHIRECAGQIEKNGLEIGRDLCEIRDDELWRDGWQSWNQYLKEKAEVLVQKSFVQSVKFIRAAEIAKRLPQNRIGVDSVLTPSHLVEIGRLAPDLPSGVSGNRGGGREKDYSKLRKPDVARVLKAATEIAKSNKKNGQKTDEPIVPSVRDVQKAVDKELGIDRTAKAAKTREKREADEKPLIEDYLRRCLGRIEGMIGHLADVPSESWTLLEESDPGLAARVAEACDRLAELLRS